MTTTTITILDTPIDARLDLGDTPRIEAESLGILLEYDRPRKCRELVRRMLDEKRLSWLSPHGGATENSANNSGWSGDVFIEEHHGQVGAAIRDTEKLWLSERACLLVATASETERAWQVRTALVDFFMEHRQTHISKATTIPRTAPEIHPGQTKEEFWAAMNRWKNENPVEFLHAMAVAHDAKIEAIEKALRRIGRALREFK